MKKILSLLAIVSLAFSLSAQEFTEPREILLPDGTEGLIRTQTIICKGSGKDHHVHTPARDITKLRGKGNTNNANFVINYIGFTTAHRNAVQFALDILATYIKSDVPIRVTATFEDLGGDGTLAGAGFSQIIANIPNANLPPEIWYPMPLAEKLAGEEITDATNPDIFISVNNNVNTNWYTDTANPTGIGPGQSDLATVIIHEVMHGLGFSGFVDANGSIGNFLLPVADDPTQRPYIFDAFLENFSGDRMITTVTNGTVPMLQFVTTGQTFFGGSSFTSGSRPELYTPDMWSTGTSLYHIDEARYGGSPQRMMTPFYNNMDVNNDPGIAMDVLYAMGWDFTDIQHSPESEYISDPTVDYRAEVKITSDFAIDTPSLQIVYSQDTFNTTNTVNMTYDAARDTFFGDIPGNGVGVDYQYYFRVNNSRGGVVTGPTREFIQFFYSVSIGDGSGPQIAHTPVTELTSLDSEIYIRATASDAAAGVDSMYAIITLNSDPEVAVPLAEMMDGFGTFYAATYDFGRNLTETDVITYRLRAFDKAPGKNETFFPSSGSLNVTVLFVPEPLMMYDTDFEGEDGSAFTGNGWRLERPAGLADSVMTQDQHPYPEAGENNTIDLIQTLISPIIVAADNDFVKFDEIVLVEPGEPGFSFGQTEFWDYVIVEAKKTSESTWRALGDGYDCNQQATWRARYLSSISGNNSTAQPLESMFRAKEYDLSADGGFSTGDTIQIRFRLFTDPFAAGWGWAIDNLNIQNPNSTVAVEEFIEEDAFEVYPNPTNTGFISVSARFKKPTSNLRTELLDMYGRLIRTKRIGNGMQDYYEEMDVSDLPSGVYFLTLRDNESAITKKVIKY